MLTLKYLVEYLRGRLVLVKGRSIRKEAGDRELFAIKIDNKIYFDDLAYQKEDLVYRKPTLKEMTYEVIFLATIYDLKNNWKRWKFVRRSKPSFFWKIKTRISQKISAYKSNKLAYSKNRRWGIFDRLVLGWKLSGEIIK